MKRPLVALLFGGKSPEYEVSCRSAATIRDALLTAGYELLPVGISREGVFYLFRGSPERIFAATWEASPGLSRIWFAPGGGFFTDSGRLYRPRKRKYRSPSRCPKSRLRTPLNRPARIRLPFFLRTSSRAE